MSDYRAISGVTKTLKKFLEDTTDVNVEVEKSPSDSIPETPPLVHLYLYRVEQNPAFRNNDFIPDSTTILRAPPIGLNLFYLMTPHGSGQLDIQTTLGEVIRVFHENPIIPPSAFDASIADLTEELRIIPHNLTLEQMTDLARSFGERPYRLSIAYEASVTVIDSRVTVATTRVRERRLELGVLR